MTLRALSCCCRFIKALRGTKIIYGYLLVNHNTIKSLRSHVVIKHKHIMTSDSYSAKDLVILVLLAGEVTSRDALESYDRVSNL